MTLKELTPAGGRESYTVAWLLWIAAFFAIELPPIQHGHPEDTLSDHVWFWFGIPKRKAPSRQVRARRFALLAFMAWLATHFLSGDDV